VYKKLFEIVEKIAEKEMERDPVNYIRTESVVLDKKINKLANEEKYDSDGNQKNSMIQAIEEVNESDDEDHQRQSANGKDQVH
jgi:hypothetical protein